MSIPPDLPPTTAPLATVVVPCFNQLEFTRRCVAALARHTRLPWELVAVDDGSTDGTADYLRGVQDAAPFPVAVLAQPTNLGFPAACNRGLAAARGELLVLLNNDAVVTDGWLDQLAALAGAMPEVGLVGPMTNYAPPPQLVEGVPYRSLEELDGFAARWRAERLGAWAEVPKLSGFCLLIKRAVYDQVGGLDERFGPGLFDDDDLCLRARRAGWRLAVAHDLFVHHYGSRTLAGSGLDTEALLAENGRKFAAKWGDAAPLGRPVAIAPWAGGPRPARRHRRRRDRGGGRPRVSLTMIVRDEERNLPACLGSVAGLFDEVVVVDTGSGDRTAAVARGLGARVSDFAWCDDFAAARNAALARATGDYAFWLDADDLVEPVERARLAALIAGLRRDDPAAYVVRCACDPDERGGGGATVVDHVRLFPRLEGVRWSYRVHEQILPALRRAGVPVRWTDLTVRHTGYADSAVRARKLGRDARILEGELAERPDDPFVLFNLGSIAVERQEWRAALAYLERSLAGSGPDDSIVRKLHALIARSHQALGEPAAALAACARGLAADPDDAELLFRKAVIHRHAGEPAAAEACWRWVLTLRPPERFSSVDAGIYGHLTRRNLALLAEERGDLAGAAGLWAAVLAECPGDAEAAAARERLAAVGVGPRLGPGPVADDELPPDGPHPDPGPEAAPAPGPAPESAPVGWLIAGSRRTLLPDGPRERDRGDDFAPYAPAAVTWCRALGARVVIAADSASVGAARALLAGTRADRGRVWAVGSTRPPGLRHPRYSQVAGDPLAALAQWDAIDLLHVGADHDPPPWLGAALAKCRAVALAGTHRVGARAGQVARALATGGWSAHEYRGPGDGWTVLARPGAPTPDPGPEPPGP